MANECSDLSPYEFARLERIKRNQNRLKELGLFKQPKQTPKPKPKTSSILRKRKQPPSAPTRSSRRLQELKEGKEKIEDDDNDSTNNVDAEYTSLIDEDTIDYERMPDAPELLDDEEFQVYISLRAWRLGRKNELEIEPYKICQNRTLCELIRRRRNDENFAKGKEANEIETDLLSVWGIGPSKATSGGFGWEMLDVLNTSENENYLMLSRKNVKVDHKQ
eukprot:scaffold2111_cov146-Skeletonema_menzelii.AAC.2